MNDYCRESRPTKEIQNGIAKDSPMGRERYFLDILQTDASFRV